MRLGISDCSLLGNSDSVLLGDPVGFDVKGGIDGSFDGIFVGDHVGELVGIEVGRFVGFAVVESVDISFGVNVGA